MVLQMQQQMPPPGGGGLGVAGLPGQNPNPPQPPMPQPSPLGLFGGPPGSQPQIPGFDPLAALDDPETLSVVLDLIAELQELRNGPVYPRWYKPKHYPKPKVTEVITKARQDHELYQLLIKRIRADRRLLRLLDVGKFKDADDIEVTFQDASLVHDVALLINLLAGCDLNYEARALRGGDAELAEKKEQFAHALREKAEREHYARYGTELAYDEAKHMVETGHICARLSLDFDAESDEVPIKVELLAPTTVFPTWDDKGICTVTRTYSEQVKTVISTWDDEGKRGIEKKLISAQVTDKQTGGNRFRTMDDQVEVIEYWDRRWKVIVAGGVEVVNIEHKFGFVPYVYGMSPFGDAGPDSLDALNGTYGMPGHTRQLELASRGFSYIWASKTTHLQREAILGRMMTELKKSANPDRTFYQSPARYGKMPKVTNAEGGISMLLKDEEEEAPPVAKPGLSLAQPLMAAAGEAHQRGLMPAASYGVTSNANQSGTALEGLNESGRDKVTPMLIALERFHGAVAEMGLTMERDWGHLLGSDGQRGELFIERMKPTPEQDSVIRLTPDELRDVGVKMSVKMTSLRLSNLGGLGQAVMPWIQAGLMEKVEALELRGVRDPIATLRRIEIERMKDDPTYKQVEMIRTLQKEGDYEAALLYQKMIAGAGGGGTPQGGMQGGAQPTPQMGQDPRQPGGMGTRGGNTPGPQGPNQAQGGIGTMGQPSRLAGPPPSMGGLPPGAM